MNTTSLQGSLISQIPSKLAAGADERIASLELAALAAHGFDAHLAFHDHAKFVFGVTHAPFTGGAGPKTAKEFLTGIHEFV